MALLVYYQQTGSSRLAAADWQQQTSSSRLAAADWRLTKTSFVFVVSICYFINVNIYILLACFFAC